MPKPQRNRTKASAGPVRRISRSGISRPAGRVRQPAPPADGGSSKRSTYTEAVTLYERGIEALQRHDFAQAAALLREVIERYPEERELLDRALLYLKVCERHERPASSRPRTAADRVYAATLELNAGRPDTALDYLQSVVREDPEHDHAFYMLAVACAQRQDYSMTLAHLRKALELNPDNRSLARTDPEFEALRETAEFRRALEVGGSQPRRRPRARTGR